MKVWSKAIAFSEKGKTAGTYDELGTVTLKIGAKEILGFLVNIVPSAVTAGENGAPILQIDSTDLGISKQRLLTSGILTDGIDTNDKEAPVFAEFVPYKAPSGKSLDNAKITFSLSGTVTTTGGWSGAISVVFADSAPDQQYVNELMSLVTPRVTGGAVAVEVAGISDASLASFGNGLTVTSDASELVGIASLVNPNAPTAGEEVVGYTELQASQIQDFSPQEWPFIVGWSPSLGTPVGTPVLASRLNGLYFPVRFPLPRVNFTINVSQKLATAITNAGDGIVAVKWR